MGANGEKGTRVRLTFGSVARALLVAGIAGYLVWTVQADWPLVRAMRFIGGTEHVIAATILSFNGLLILPAIWIMMTRRIALFKGKVRWFLLRVWMQSYFFRYVPGKVMLAVERVRLGRMAGIPAAVSMALLLWEQILVIAGSALVVGAAFSTGRISESWDLVPADLTVWLIPALIVGMAGFFVLIRWAPRLPKIGSALSSLKILRFALLDQIGFFLAYGIQLMVMSAGFAFVFRLFVPLDSGDMLVVATWFIVAHAAGFLATVAPAGLGVREAVLVLGLSSLLPGGQVVALAVAGRLWMTAVEAVCFAVILLIPAPSERVGGHQESG